MKFGTLDLDNIKVGDQQVDKVMAGTEEVWVNELMPIGSVMPYTGAISAIDDGWAVCDGTNGTVDMTDKFVYGANNDADNVTAGGSADAVVVSHTHLGTFVGNPLPEHTHSGRQTNLGAGRGGGDVTQRLSANTPTEAFSGGTPRGTVTINSAGESGVGRNIPPYTKLLYIQRIA